MSIFSTIPADRLAMLDTVTLYSGSHPSTGDSACKHCARKPDIDECQPWPADEGDPPWYANCYAMTPTEHCVGANGDTRVEAIRAWNAEVRAVTSNKREGQS